MTNTPITDQRVEEIELMDLTPEQEKAELIILARNLESERNGFENELISTKKVLVDTVFKTVQSPT